MTRGGSIKPLITLALLVGIVILMFIVFKLREESVVRAPGIIYPQNYWQIVGPNQFRVIEVKKKDGDSVNPGDELVIFDSEQEKLFREEALQQINSLKAVISQYDMLVEQRKLEVKSAKELVKEAEAGIAAAQAQMTGALALQGRAAPEIVSLELARARGAVEQAELRERLMKKHYENQETLYKLFAERATLEQLELKKADWDLAVNVTQQARKDAEVLEKDIAMRVAQAKAAVESANSMIRAAEARLGERQRVVDALEFSINVIPERAAKVVEIDRLKVEERRLTDLIAQKVMRAPIKGVLKDFNPQPGQWVSRQLPMGWIFDDTELVFRAYVQQRDLSRVSVGQNVRLYLDSQAARVGRVEAVEARVDAVSMDALPPALTSTIGEPTTLFSDPRQPTAVPLCVVRMKISKTDDRNKLRIGFTGQARIWIEKGSPFTDLAKRLFY